MGILNGKDTSKFILQAAGVGIFTIDPQGCFAYINPTAAGLLGSDPDSLLGRNHKEILHEAESEDEDRVSCPVCAILFEGATQRIDEQSFTRSDGQLLPVDFTANPLHSDGVFQGVVVVFNDITDRQSTLKALEHNGLYDPLTELPNRSLFIDRLNGALERTRSAEGHRFALLYIDLDLFQKVNDTLGYKHGDELLRLVGARLKSCLRQVDTLAHFSGDEFAILLDGIKDYSAGVRVAERILSDLSKPFKVFGHEVSITASIGVAMSSRGYVGPSEPLRDADLAMARAKRKGRSRYACFDREMHSRATERMELETSLFRALEMGQFLLHYQPIVLGRTGDIMGLEALIRWNHPDQGLLLPAAFLEVAEEAGSLVEIGEWVLGEACRQTSKWHCSQPGRLPWTISVNLSARQLLQPDLPRVVMKVLGETGLQPSSLKLEITESALMGDLDRAKKVFDELCLLGIKLQLDDFGTGYSSLQMLHQFPLDTLKIDRTFVSGLDEHRHNIEIIRTIVALAHTLDMTVIAEGAETRHELETLLSLGCEYVQGYFFSEPVPADQVVQLVEKQLEWLAESLPLKEAPEAAVTTS
jgi:diguanylate cyclase (GGDEF)-like protein/PAS domain S-box-containing protein